VGCGRRGSVVACHPHSAEEQLTGQEWLPAGWEGQKLIL
jgi:uncharacterized protein YecA (UPF0149 family)